ncbi:ribosome biogenesis GTPase Der, partial [Candidatus Berkelbacteria bacterium]|nr:ribosome biogenesis GTPase Der [Candidatus Berkelbacteria bacterium]
MGVQKNQKSDIPIIAIVGRPNVGKSTLYNRIIRQRVAIESDEPLTTRDRLTNDFFWRGQNYFLIDTAGLINPTDEILSESIKATELAIAEADLILFMVDFKDSMTDADMAIARRLKKGDKPIILVANKCDHQFTPADILKFKWAGFTDIILISAMFGKKVDELLDKIAEMAGKSSKAIKPKKADTFIPVAICGRPNVGKSTLINQIIGQDRMIVSSIPHTTRDSQDITFQYKSKNIRLVDTAGVSKKARMDRGSVESFAFLRSMQAIAKSEIVVYIFDADEKVSRLDLNTIGQAKNLGKSIIIAVNKTDL